MRKLVISLLLASAMASPALASGIGDRADQQQAREDRQQAREERQQARDNNNNNDARPSARPERTQPPVERQNVQRPDMQRPDFQRPDFQRPTMQRPDFQRPNVQRPDPRANAAQQFDGRRDFDAQRAERQQQFRQRMDDNRALRDQRRDDRLNSRQPVVNRRPPVVNRRPPVVSSVPRPGTQPPLPVSARPARETHWNTTSWRNDHRYDWQDYRRRHHSLFHLSFYYDPFGWGYSPFQIGWRMWPSYYTNSNYWLDDPWMYRLPYAPPGYRWIRYYDDAILIDTWSGQVADVIYGFFW